MAQQRRSPAVVLCTEMVDQPVVTRGGSPERNERLAPRADHLRSKAHNNQPATIHWYMNKQIGMYLHISRYHNIAPLQTNSETAL